MLGDATGPINFTVFLTLMADKMANTDSDNTILKAFSAFDDNRNGKINAQYLRECMTTMGDRFTDEEVQKREHRGRVYSYLEIGGYHV